jgi:lipopolysaccharide exporter
VAVPRRRQPLPRLAPRLQRAGVITHSIRRTPSTSQVLQGRGISPWDVTSEMARTPDEPSPPLTPDARRGARLGALNLAATQVGSVLATVALARLLTPGDFGIVALAQSLLGLAVIFAISGVRAAILTRGGEVAEAADTYFWTTFGFASMVWIIIAAAAVPLTGLLGQPSAAPYVIVLAGSVLFGLTSAVPLGLIQRRLNFRAYYASQLGGSLVYFVSEVALALFGLGAWSVILGQVLNTFVTLVLALSFARWFPKPRFSRRVLREDAGFLGGQTLNGGLSYLQRNVDYWAVSRLLGGSPLGVYYIAYVLPNTVRLRLTSLTSIVLLPAYAAVQADQRRLERAWQRSWLLQAGLGIPALLGIAALASPIVAVFFGPQWTAAVVPIQILTIVALVDVHMSTVAVMAAARRRVAWNTIVVGIRLAATTVFAVGAAVMFGTLTAVAWGVALASLLTLIAQEATASRYLGVGLRPILRPLLVYVALGGLMVLVLGLLEYKTPEWRPIAELVTGVAVGAGVYLGVGSLLAGRYIRPLVREARGVIVGR